MDMDQLIIDSMPEELRKGRSVSVVHTSGQLPAHIYAIFVGEPAHVYVGASTNVNTRFETHLNDLNAGRHCNHKLQTLFDESEEEPQFYIMEQVFCANANELSEHENRWIKKLMDVVGQDRMLNINMKSSAAHFGKAFNVRPLTKGIHADHISLAETSNDVEKKDSNTDESDWVKL